MRWLLVVVLLAISALSAQAQPAYTLGNATNSQFTSTGGSTARSLAASNADIENVLSFGADPTGAADSSTAISAALAATRNGVVGNAYLPAGVYHIAHPITVGSASSSATSQCLQGDGWSTIIDVSTDMATTAAGIVQIASSTATAAQFCIRDVQIRFHQPPDLVSLATAISASGTNTITVANSTGVVMGDYVTDPTNTLTIPAFLAGGVNTTVTGITGNVITLSNNLLTNGVAINDAIHFAQPRANFTALSAGCSLTAGSPGCAYPWAIYNPNMQNVYLDHVFILGSWDGIYQRGAAYYFNDLYVSAIDQALNQDTGHNFPQVNNFMSYSFTDFDGQTAFNDNYYDGSTVCANWGASDGLAAVNIQCWTGISNLTSNWSWGSFANYMLDGNFATLNIAGGTFAEFTNLYTTGVASSGCKITISGGHNTFAGSYFSSASRPVLCASAGDTVVSGSMIIANTANINVIQQTGGALTIASNSFEENTGAGNWTTNAIIAESGSSRLSLIGNNFNNAGSGGDVAASFTDTAQITIADNALNGWLLSGTGTLGSYQTNVPSLIAGNTFTGANTFTGLPFQVTNSTTASNELVRVLEASLGTGNFLTTTIGTGLATNNAGSLIFTYTGGTGSATNTIGLSMWGQSKTLILDGNGNTSAQGDLIVGAPTGGHEGTGTVNAAAAYYANGTVGVSCSAGTINLTTAIATNGILTHC